MKQKKRKKTKKIANFVNKFQKEKKKIIRCQNESCNKEWDNVIEIKELGKFFFCMKHADDFEEQLPNIINNLPEAEAKKIVEANK